MVLSIIGAVLICCAIISMGVVGLKMVFESRKFNHGVYYADEFGRKVEQLRERIPLLGVVMLFGVLFISVSFMVR